MTHRTVAIAGVVALACVLVLWAGVALARDPDGRYANVDPAVREWYRTRTLTPEAQQRFGYKSCCDAGDVVLTKFRPEGDRWLWLNVDKWQVVPPDIIHYGEVTPTGEPVLFVVGGNPVCFFPGAGGT
jgi:hypothetical protein